jgi:tight adherence protein B
MISMKWANVIFASLAVAVSAGMVGWVFTKSFLKNNSKPLPKLLDSQQKISLKLPEILLMIGLFVALIIAFCLDFFLSFLLFILVILIWFVVQKSPHWIRTREMKKKQSKMVEVFPQTLGMAVQALKTGQTVPQVVEYLSKECQPPLKEELASVCGEIDLGASAEQALTKMADRFPHFQEFHQFLESYKISRQTGANLTHLLEVLLDGMEEKNRILRKMDAMTSQARLSGLMMGSLPFMLAFVFFLMDPNLITPLFTQKIGWAILFTAFFLEGVGFWWIQQLLQLEV